MRRRARTDALHQSGAVWQRRLERAELLLFGFFANVRLGRLLIGALARAFGGAYIVRVVIGFLHGELKIKQLAIHRKTFSQE